MSIIGYVNYWLPLDQQSEVEYQICATYVL